MKKEKVMVKSEFAPLKKVVLTQSEFIFPQNTIGNDLAEVLSEEVLQMYKDVDGKNYKDAFPDRQAKWEKESGKEYGCSNFFVRDKYFKI